MVSFRWSFLPLAALVLTAACSSSPDVATAEQPAMPGIDRSKLLDLSYTYDADTIYWPNADGFRHRKDVWAITDGGYWYAAGEFTSAEHGGTHIDAPIHFFERGQSVDEIPVQNLIAPMSVIDVSAQAAQDPDYRVTAADIQNWEEAHGRLEETTIAMFRTGWGQYWPDRLSYMGDDTPGDIEHLHFPGLSAEAAELLVQRGIAGVAIDTASMDYGASQDFIVHQILMEAGIYGVENVANAAELPETGATMIALPLKIAEGSGSPARVVALLP